MEIYFLLYDIPLFGPIADPSSLQKTKLAPIGELMTKKNSVRVQAPGDLVWEDTQTGQVLFRKQSILTLENSKADVAFLDGTGLVVDENSLIQLEKNPSDDSQGYQKIIVKLLRGSVRKVAHRKKSELLRKETQVTPDFEVHVGNTVAKVAPATELMITSTPESPGNTVSKIQVQNGEVQIASPQGELTLKPGDVASISQAENAAPEVKRAPFILLGPSGGESLSAVTNQAINFRWNVDRASVGVTPLKLELSRDPEFTGDVTRLTISATSPPMEHVQAKLKVPVPSRPSEYYWRVSSVNNPKLKSDTEKFWLEAERKPILEFPAHLARATAGGAIDFAWQEVEGAMGYELELTGASVSPIQSQKPFARLENIPAGDLQWRIRAKLKNGENSPWSESRQLSVVAPKIEPPKPEVAPPPPAPVAAPPAPAPAIKPKKSAPPPPPTELEAPEILPDAEKPGHSWLDFLIPQAWADEKPTAWKIKLKWKPVEGVSKYKIQISRTKNFGSVLSETQVDQPEWAWRYKVGMENSKGRVFYRVASMNEEGETGAFSQPKAIQIPEAILDGTYGSTPTTVARKGQPEITPVMDLDEPAPKPTPTPTPKPVAPKPDPSPTPAAASSVAIAPPAYERMLWSVGLDTGLGNISQSSGASNLTSVSTQGAFLQQKLVIAAQKAEIEAFRDIHLWTFQLEASFAAFHKPNNTARTIEQPDVKAFNIKLDAIKWAKRSGWHLGYGATLDRSFRWAKSGLQSVEAQYALSLGPILAAMRKYDHGRGVRASSAGVVLDLPFTGVLTRGHMGIKGKLWGEWQIARFQKDWLGAVIEGEATYLRWSTPTSTSTSQWAIWLGPVYHFGVSRE